MGTQTTATVSASREALQQCHALAQGAAAPVGLRSGIAVQTGLISLVRRPIDIPLVVFWDEHGPFRSRKQTNPLFDLSLLIDIALTAGFAITVGAAIDRIGEDIVNDGIGRRGPANFISLVEP